ncbi:MAG: hypothetical protein ACRDG3_05870 [Tepidiformaceae bacterium]
MILSPSVKAFIEGVASDYTRPIVDDGVVTIAEYERSFFAMIQCFKDHGIVPDSPPVLDASRHYSYSLSFAAGDAAQSQTAVAACQAYYFEAVQRAWGTFSPPGFDRLLAQARQAIGACMRSAGMDAPDQPTHDDVVELVKKGESVPIGCIGAAQQQFNIFGIMP